MIKIISLLTLLGLTGACGQPDDVDAKPKQQQSNVAIAYPKTIQLAGKDITIEMEDLIARLQAAGAEELRRNSNTAYFEEADSHLVLALSGVRAVFGDFGLPNYEEAGSCDAQGHCSAVESKFSPKGWSDFLRDLFRGMDGIGVAYREGDRVNLARVISFAVNGK